MSYDGNGETDMPDPEKMTHEERLDFTSFMVHSILQQALANGYLDGGMMGNWYLVGNVLDEDGTTGTLTLSDLESVHVTSLGLVRVAVIMVEEEIREWLNDRKE